MHTHSSTSIHAFAARSGRLARLAAVLAVAMVMTTLLAVPSPAGAADESEVCQVGGDDVIMGTEGDDVLVGTQHSDVICGLGGDDVIEGGNGEDLIYGGAGDDTISGGNGRDHVDGGAGDDVIDGGNGKDAIDAGDGVDVVDGGNGVDGCANAEQPTSCETIDVVVCPDTPTTAILSHTPGETVDTSAAGNGTGSFVLAGVAPWGTEAVTATLGSTAADTGIADIEYGACQVTWAIEAQVPLTQTIEVVVTATGPDGQQVDAISLHVIAPAEDDVLLAPEFASTPQRPEALQSYDAETGRMVFDGDLSQELEPGAGLVSGPLDLAPEGYLRVVEAVTLEGGSTVVATRQAGLTEYVRQIDVQASIPPGQGDPMVLGSGAPAQSPSFQAQSAEPSFQAISTEDFDLVADFIIDPGFDIDIDIDFRRDGCTFCLPSVVVDRILVEASVDLKAEASVTYRGATLFEQQAGFGPRLDDFRLGTVVIPLPVGAIVISLEAEGQAFYEISVDAAMRLEYTIGVHLEAGYEYRGDGQGRGAYSDAWFTGGLTDDGLELRAGILVTAAAGIEMDLEALLWGQAGFELEARPKIELEAFADAVSRTIPWKLQLVVPIDGSLEVEIDLGPIEYDKEFGNIEFAQLSLILLDGVIAYEDEDEEEDPGDDVVGDGVSVVDDEVTGSPDQWGRVDGFVPGERTWVLSTGLVADTVGAPSTFASTALGLPGDARLSALSGFATYDATAYVATVIPEGTTLHVRYAFASEEYPEYVGSSYNDVMAVFVDGVNCAFVPGTQIPVAINTVNAQTNPQYYVDNTLGASGYGTTMDGLTTPLTCSVPVTAGQQVEVRIAVADSSDGIYDSAVALLDGGIWSD